MLALRLELVELTEPAGRQLELLAAGAEDRSRLSEGLRQVCASTGSGSVCTVVEVAPWSRIPETRALVRTAGRLNEPRPARVESNFDGTPWQVNHQSVALVREEWRVLDRWWTEEPILRRYFEVVLETGENTVVFHDGAGGRWFTQRGA